MTVALLGGMIVILAGLVGAFIYLKKRKKSPLTTDSLPPMPTQQEASQHFTPTPTITVKKKPNVNKKLIIALAVVFNIILIGGVVLIGQNLTQQQPITINSSAAPTTPFPSPTLDTSPTLPASDSVGTNSRSLLNQQTDGTASGSDAASASPSALANTTCTPMPPCVQQKTCDVAVPDAGWCPPEKATGGLSADSTTGSTTESTQTSPSVLSPTVPLPTQPTSLTSTPTPILVAANYASPTTAPSGGVTGTAVLPTIPDVGNPLPLLLLIVPAFLVAIAFIL